MNKKQDGRKNNGGAGRNQGRTKDYNEPTYRHQVTVPTAQKIPFTEHVENFLKPFKNKKP